MIGAQSPERVYLRHARTAHLLPPYASPNEAEPALCGVQPGVRQDWWGTGSQAERERAAELPTCLACERIRRRT